MKFDFDWPSGFWGEVGGYLSSKLTKWAFGSEELKMDLGFTACQDYFTHFEQNSIVRRGENWSSPREKPPDHPQAELGLSHDLS